MAVDATRRLTCEAHAAPPDDGERHQIIDGVLVLTPPPDADHQALVGRLHLGFRTYLERNPIGRVFIAPLDVVLDRYNVVQPDILYVSQAREHIITPPNIQGAPDLVVEVLAPSTSRLDLGRKRDLYAAHGVREFWAVHTDKTLVMVYPLLYGTAKFGRPRLYTAARTLTTPLLQGFALDVAALYGVPKPPRRRRPRA